MFNYLKCMVCLSKLNIKLHCGINDLLTGLHVVQNLILADPLCLHLFDRRASSVKTNITPDVSWTHAESLKMPSAKAEVQGCSSSGSPPGTCLDYASLFQYCF